MVGWAQRQLRTHLLRCLLPAAAAVCWLASILPLVHKRLHNSRVHHHAIEADLNHGTILHNLHRRGAGGKGGAQLQGLGADGADSNTILSNFWLHCRLAGVLHLLQTGLT